MLLKKHEGYNLVIAFASCKLSTPSKTFFQQWNFLQ